MKQTLYLIRHGHTEGTEQKLVYGWTELSLSEDGSRELAELREADIYPSVEGARLYTSGMLRTEQTFEIIFGDLEHERVPSLKEINMGIHEMRPFTEVIAEDWGRDWLSGKMPDLEIEGGESQNQFVARVQNGMREVIEDNIGGDNESMIVVCHGGVIAFIMDGLFPNGELSEWEWTPYPGLGYEVELEDGRPLGFKLIGKPSK